MTKTTFNQYTSKQTVTDAQEVPNTNMVPHKEIEIDNNILVPFEEMYTRHHKFHE